MDDIFVNIIQNVQRNVDISISVEGFFQKSYLARTKDVWDVNIFQPNIRRFQSVEHFKIAK